MKKFNISREAVSLAMAYVGVLVGAGLSSGQDLLQYFLSFGRMGLLGVALLGVLNIIFGRIIVTLGSHYQSSNHQEVLEQIAHPVINRIIDVTLILSCFVVGFVMVAGAGANLQQQFGLPSWLGALICSLLVIVIAFLDFDRITKVLGIFTPLVVIMILAAAGCTFWNGSFDLDVLDAAAASIKPVMPNVGLSVLNYFALCAMNGVSMAFVLGGSVLRITDAEKGGALGGAIISVIVGSAALTLFANLDLVKDAEIPMLVIVNHISPLFALAYALVIFALIFNTAFSLYYATAKRFAGNDEKKLRRLLIGIVALGYVCSFGGFTTLVSYLYPILGFMGILLLVVLTVAWFKERENIIQEKMLRRKMIRLLFRKYDDDYEFTNKTRLAFHKLGKMSAADTESLKASIKAYAKAIAQKHDNLRAYAEKHLSLDGF
ncbi:YkvI family membrane protein [Selenomonas ruminantium]|uniref:Uncharacterized membrane protein YkvI n=1 Tax=Selenomonas ruminantium TaxID=971 RepID=A0A1H0NHS2_SELRU|nr:hypothetical protein [Selenomonas ruminantium]SDO92244.1 Uncharacterized membrane protein YkvI [Selenomonas ruminantium]